MQLASSPSQSTSAMSQTLRNPAESDSPTRTDQPTNALAKPSPPLDPDIPQPTWTDYLVILVRYFQSAITYLQNLMTYLQNLIPQSTTTYLQYFIPLTVVSVFPLAFAGYTFANGRVVAWQWLADFTKSNPSAKGQIVAILATSLTATLRWGFGGAAALLARKRLLKPRPIYEIDMFFRLVNISVVWDWKHRTGVAFLTWFLVAICGLLTSGFFTLLNPLELKTSSQQFPVRELNFAVNSGRLAEWYDKEGFSIVSKGSLGTNHDSVSLSDSPGFLQSMTRQYITSKNQSKTYPAGSFVTSFKELGYTSFMGSTAGALISGTPGSEDPAFPVTPLGRPKMGNYSLDLQGMWIDVSCSTGETPPLTFTINKRGAYGVGTRGLDFSFLCPGSIAEEWGRVMNITGLVLAFNCPTESETTTIYFRSLSLFKQVENVTCKVTPRIGEVNAVLDPSVQAFTISKKSSTILPSLPSVARNFTSLIVGHVMRQFQTAPLLLSVAEAQWHFKKEAALQEGMFEDLVEMVMSAVFEFEASYARFAIMRDGKLLSELPPESAREVRVVLDENMVGWEVRWTTWLGLVPLVVVGIIAFFMIAIAFFDEGNLTLFDPMSPVSLLAATGVGEVVFDNEATGKTVGDPLDENVLVTKVFYGEKDQGWGLWSSEGGMETSCF